MMSNRIGRNKLQDAVRLFMSHAPGNSSGSDSKRMRVSWKKIFIGLPVLLALILLADRGLFGLFTALEKNAARFNLEEKLRAIPEKEKYEVLVFGTSRTYNAIQPKYVNPVIGSRLFKESFVNKGPKYNYYFYRLYKEIFGVPKVVVYGLDYFLFDIVSSPEFLRRFPECKDISETGKRGPSLLLANKERLDRYVNDMVNRFQKTVPGQNRKFDAERNFSDMEKFEGKPAPEKTKLVTEIPPDFEKMKKKYTAFPGVEGAYYMRLLEELKKDHVAIFLVTIPNFIGSFRTQLNPRLFMGDQIKILKKLDYKGRAFLADYNAPRRFPMDDAECFLDGGYGQINNHLSVKGSKIFCRMFSRDLKNILNNTRRRILSAAPAVHSSGESLFAKF